MTFVMISYILMYFGAVEKSFHSRFHGTKTKTGENLLKPTSKFDLYYLDDRVSDVRNRCSMSMWVCK